MILTKWVETTAAVYRTIKGAHSDDLTVFGTITRMGDGQPGSGHLVTEWGFKNADAPLIKHESRSDENGDMYSNNTEHKYFIACNMYSDD